jgi:E3 ubiquitin-protein ligase RHA2
MVFNQKLTPIRRHRHRTLLLPRLSHDDEAARKDERMQKRRDELESSVKTQHFYDWLATQKEKHPNSLLTTDPVW